MGLGNAEAYMAVAGCYTAAWEALLPWSREALARDIAVAKVASVVHLLHAHADDAARVSDELVAWLVDAVPSWVRRLV